jgi:hypothetical protein
MRAISTTKTPFQGFESPNRGAVFMRVPVEKKHEENMAKKDSRELYEKRGRK